MPPHPPTLLCAYAQTLPSLYYIFHNMPPLLIFLNATLLWILGSGLRDVGSGLKDLGSGFLHLGSGHRAHGTGIWDLGFGGLWALGSRFWWALGSRFWWALGYGMWALGCGMWDVGCGLLALASPTSHFIISKKNVVYNNYVFFMPANQHMAHTIFSLLANS